MLYNSVGVVGVLESGSSKMKCQETSFYKIKANSLINNLFTDKTLSVSYADMHELAFICYRHMMFH
jgi:hypothetical protein